MNSNVTDYFFIQNSISNNTISTCICKASYNLESWLNQNELNQWLRRRDRLNNLDWLSGRIAAKHALLSWARSHGFEVQLNPQEIIIFNSDNGRPMISWDPKLKPLISISHCRQIGYAAVSNEYKAVGCDIEIVRPHPLRFKDIFLASAELSWINQYFFSRDPNFVDTLMWSLKEAVLKCLFSLGCSKIHIKKIIVKPDLEGRFSFFCGDLCGSGTWLEHKNFICSVATCE